MDKYNLWLSSFDKRDLLTGIVFAITAAVLLYRHIAPGWAKKIIDPTLGGLYCVAFVLVTAFFRPTL